MKLRDTIGLTFDDVLLVPKRSSVASRKDVRTTAKLTKQISLAIPILSANMDTVTESRMAIAMARAGGLGVIHRFMTPERQAASVSKVKRAESFVVEVPATIRPDAPVAEARERMEDAGIGGLVVVNDDGRVVGLVTTRDVLFAPEPEQPVSEVMTRRQEIVTAPAGIGLQEARRLLHENRIEKLPLVEGDGQDGKLHGLITAQDIIKLEQHPLATKDSKGRLRVAAAVGTRASDLERAALCVDAGADVLVVDIAHGHADHALAMIKRLKQDFPKVDVIGGNVATAEGVRDMAGAGADAVKVGVGAGSICITRIVTGFGVPQLTAVMDCAEVAHALDLPLVADGGIRSSGDLTKALAAGASTVMVGSLLAGTDESPGAPVVRDGRRFKVVRGMASLTANVDRQMVETGSEIDPEDWDKVVPEGVEAVVPHRGATEDILHQLVGGLRSGLSYAGAASIDELWQNAEFIRITSAGMKESGAHDVLRI